MVIDKEQIKRLKPFIKNIDELVEHDDIQEILDAIDDLIIDNILGNHDEPDERGIQFQKIYDEIYYQNL
jgi:hypothetical protein